MSETPDLSLVEYRALAEFRFELRRFLQFSETAARETGLEPQQHQMLLTVMGLPAGAKPTIRELASRMLLKHHSAVELIDRLERRGAVARSSDPEDARAVLVNLTRSGEQLLRRLALAHREELETAGPALARALGNVLRSVQRTGEAA